MIICKIHLLKTNKVKINIVKYLMIGIYTKITF